MKVCTNFSRIVEQISLLSNQLGRQAYQVIIKPIDENGIVLFVVTISKKGMKSVSRQRKLTRLF